jgi:hypothetical protein
MREKESTHSKYINEWVLYIKSKNLLKRYFKEESLTVPGLIFYLYSCQ